MSVNTQLIIEMEFSSSARILLLVVSCVLVLPDLPSAAVLPDQSKSAVYFSVVRTSGVSAGSAPVTITYNEINANVGNGYNQQGGHFRAPVSGYYFLSMSMRSGRRTNTVKMLRNGLVIMSTYQRDYGSGSNQVIKYLNEGDEVWTQVQPRDSISDRFITFSGFLLY